MMLIKIKSACKIAKFPQHIKISRLIFKTHPHHSPKKPQ